MRALVLLLATVGFAVGCELTVAAASDLASLEKPLGSALSDCKVRWVFGSSGTLSRQIANGADFDLFLSASRTYIDSLEREKALDPGSVTPYARGHIAIWPGNADLEKAVHLALANPAHAPYGLAAKQALERQGLWAKLEKRVVFAENVRQAWQFAVSGNADAAITAWSLVHNRGGRLIEERWHDPIIQVGAIPRRSRNPSAARRLLQWMTGPEGQKLFVATGFGRAQ